MPMDAFVLVKTLRAAIYGKVTLVRHRASGVVYAMKVMSLAHMDAQRAIAGPVVSEDGNTELRVLRRLSGTRVTTVDGRKKTEEADVEEVGAGGMDRGSASAHPTWDAVAGRSSARTPVDHHHVLTLHADFVDARAHARCLVFDYCPYGELYDQLQKAPHKTLALATTRAYFAQIATAVRFVHSMNIAHRDLSLENVLVDANRQCRLGDFGLACEFGTMCSGRVGKAFYMAPEVYDWQPDEFYNGLQADMWSLGIILFILATGAPPFEAAHEIDARFRVVKARGIRELLAVWKLDEKLPYQVCDLLEMLLRVDPDDRADIEGVCAHPWLQGTVDAQDDAAIWGISYPSARSARAGGQSVDGEAYKSSDEEFDEPSEPQEEVDVEVACHAGSNSGMDKKRQRKRIKISVEDSLMVPSAPSTGRVAGFFGGPFASDEVMMRIGLPPTLRHERFHAESSPDGTDRRAVAPKTSPVAWPRISSKPALRSLFQPARDVTDGSNDEEGALNDHYESKKAGSADEVREPSACRRRPRLDSSSSCSSMSSDSNEQDSATSASGDPELDAKKLSAVHNVPTHRCRFCLEWVQPDRCTKRVTLPTREDSSGVGECRSKTRWVCDSCFSVVSAALVSSRDSDGAVDEAQWFFGPKRHAPQAA